MSNENKPIRTNNDGVARAWSNGESARNGTNAYSTNGRDLYSYRTRIGFTTAQGTKILLDYTAKTGNFLSMTTSSKHLPPARGYADEVMNPSVVHNLEKFQ